MASHEGKVACVTGGGSGIGRALVLELAARGASIVLADLRRDRAEETARAVTAAGADVQVHVLDVADREAMDRMVGDAAERYGRLDLMVNNAGVGVAGDPRDLSPEDWRRVIEVNLFGTIHGTLAAYAVMARQGFGHIVNVSSVKGLVPIPGTSSYVASKHGVVGLSMALRVEGAPLGVKVTAACPGYVEGSWWENLRTVNLDGEALKRRLPRQSGLSPEECARRILRGVERNRALVVTPWPARLLWLLHRLSPDLVMGLMVPVARAYRESRIRP